MQDPYFNRNDREVEFQGDQVEKREEKDSILSFLSELPVLILTAIVVAWLIKSFLVQPFYIPSGSMEPTLLPGDRVLVTKFLYRFRDPEPHDVIVFEAPEIGGTQQDFIKRIVATSGMTVEVKNGKLFVDDKAKIEKYVRPDSPNSNFGPTTVPKQELFVMGDNRANSKDSRFFGPIKKDALEGKAFVIYWPPNRIGALN